jgi:CheY-like chemotaxis protein
MKTFLLVSDSDSKHEVISRTLEKVGGYDLKIAATLEKAQELVRNEEWDVIFWDYFLREQITIPLVEEARARFPNAKMTAFSYDHRRSDDLREAGCDNDLDPATYPTVLEILILKYAGHE